jgi:dual specificity phosphatase 12
MRKEGSVLIHCAAGISRSVALLTSYMMNKYQTSFQNCIDYIKSKRGCANPNDGFKIQLKKFEIDLGIKNSKHTFN